jgi:hypothetical protein
MSLLRGICVWAMLAGAAAANPNGAPWGSAKPGTAQGCASCHFDYDPALESELVAFDGLPQRLAPGAVYDLVLTLAPSDAAIAGFMASASAGSFSASGQGIEANGSEIRSIAPLPAGEGARWKMKWTAPADISGEVYFYTAVNGANDDASPFGDIIHFRSFAIPAGQ